jgi:hypothetical protein
MAVVNELRYIAKVSKRTTVLLTASSALALWLAVTAGTWWWWVLAAWNVVSTVLHLRRWLQARAMLRHPLLYLVALQEFGGGEES